MAELHDPMSAAVANVLAGIIHRVSLTLARDNPEFNPEIDRYIGEIRDRLYADRWSLEKRLKENTDPTLRKQTEYHLDIVTLLYSLLDMEDPDLVERSRGRVAPTSD